MLSVLLIFAFSLLSYVESNAQGLACNNNVQVSLNEDCEADITPGMILEGEDENNPNYSVSIEGVSGTIVTTPGTYTVTVTDATDGNSCWGTITVEDKLAPQIESCDCPPGNTDDACQFVCTELGGILDGSVTVPAPVVVENCGNLTSEYSDLVTEGGCGETIITRSWLFTDDSGNETEGCTQEFRTIPAEFSDVTMPVSPVVLGCGADASMPGIVAHYTPLVGATEALTYGYPTVNGVAINGTVCNLGATKVDVVIPVCEQSCSNSFKVIRDWSVLDWCSGEVITFNQIIEAKDLDAPTIDAEDQQASTNPWDCISNFYLDAPVVLHDDCTDFVEYTVSGPAGVTITWSPTFQRYYVEGAPKGIHQFTYTGSDCCGNTAQDQILVTITDQTAPVAVAKQNIVVSLTNGFDGNGTAKIFAPSVDNGSHDGCTDVRLEIRRDFDNCNVNGNDTYNNDGHTFDSNTDPDNGQFVKFCCDDLTRTEVDIDGDGIDDEGYIKVWLRVWDDGDMNGTYGSSGDNFNETWAIIKVEDKLNPQLTCPANITIECDDDATDLSLTGSATGAMTCGPADVEYTDVINNVDNCGVGTIRRRWNIVGSPAIFCDQIITKSAGSLFNGNISWPADYTTDCTDIDGSNQEPTWNSPSCSLVGYSVESDTFQFEDGACFKIINEWTVLDWCQYDPNNANTGGIWTHTQVIRVVDNEAPVMDCSPGMYAVDDYTDADNDGDLCEAIGLMLTNTAEDNGDCASAWLKWTVLVDIWGDGTYDYEFSSSLPISDSNFNTDNNGNGIPDAYLAPTLSGEEVKVTLPDDIASSMNNHKVRWSVSDGCQNVTSCETTFMVVDKKAPTPYCIDISTALMDNGMVEIWACDFDLGSFDNCTASDDLRFTFSETRPQNDPNFDESTGCSSRVFDCDDLTGEPVTVSMYVWDEKDNFDYCEVELTLVDNQGGCESGDGMRVAGSVVTPSQQPIEDLEIKIEASAVELIKFDMSNEEGEYTFFNLPAQLNYKITAEKNDNYLDGVSTLDLVKIQRHILGLDELNDAYKVIAGDINADEKLSASDLLQLRKLILGITTELPDNGSYVMIDGTQQYADANNPWPINANIQITPLEHDMADQDLVAIKVGDVSDNATYGLTSTATADTRSAKTLALTHEVAQNDGKVSIPVAIDTDESLYGLQMTLQANGISDIRIASQSIQIESSNIRIDGDQISISWSLAQIKEFAKGDVLFTIEGKSTGNTGLSIDSKSSITAEAYGSDLKVMDMTMEKRSTEVVEGFAVSQNVPNPFSDETVIAYHIDQSQVVTLTVTDIAGKVVHTEQTNATAGNGQFAVQANALGQSGIYYYTVKTHDEQITNKLVVIK